jgi:hypothetical protein
MGQGRTKKQLGPRKDSPNGCSAKHNGKESSSNDEEVRNSMM